MWQKQGHLFGAEQARKPTVFDQKVWVNPWRGCRNASPDKGSEIPVKRSPIEQDGSRGLVPQRDKTIEHFGSRAVLVYCFHLSLLLALFIVGIAMDQGLKATIQPKARAIPERFNIILFCQDFLLTLSQKKHVIMIMTCKTFLAAFCVCT